VHPSEDSSHLASQWIERPCAVINCPASLLDIGTVMFGLVV
jgi:hypothetical protein